MERELFKNDGKVLVVNLKLLEVLQNKITFNEAIILQQIDYWTEIAKAKKEKKNFLDNKYWYHSSVKKMHERNFKFCFSIDVLKRNLKTLEENNFLITIKKNNAKYYRINYEEINKYFNIFEKENKKNEEKESWGKMHQPKKELGQNAPTSWGKMHQPVRAKCTNQLGQNAPTIKEINKEIIYIDYKIDLSKKKIRLKNIGDKFILKKIKKQEISKKSTQKTAKNPKNEKLDYEFKPQIPKLDVLRYELDVSEDFASKCTKNDFASVTDGLNGRFEISKKDVNVKQLINDTIQEVLSDNKKFFTINKEKVKSEIVKEKFKKLKKQNIDYCYKKYFEEKTIKNSKNFIISTLYNSVIKEENKKSEVTNLGYDWFNK